MGRVWYALVSLVIRSVPVLPPLHSFVSSLPTPRKVLAVLSP